MNRLIIIFFVLILISQPTFSQETKTIFGGDYNISFIWGFDFKINSIQGKPGTLAGIYGGTLINNSTILALTIASNIGHPNVNYSYIGLWSQYTYKPYQLIHFSGQLLLALGTTKDYNKPKTSTMDNFGNTSGPGFYIIEPGVLTEINLSEKFRLGVGVNYRLSLGLDSNNILISKTKVSNEDMSGINFVINLKIGLYDVTS